MSKITIVIFLILLSLSLYGQELQAPIIIDGNDLGLVLISPKPVQDEILVEKESFLMILSEIIENTHFEKMVKSLKEKK